MTLKNVQGPKGCTPLAQAPSTSTSTLTPYAGTLQEVDSLRDMTTTEGIRRIGVVDVNEK